MYYYRTDTDFQSKVDKLPDVVPYFVTVMDKKYNDRSYNTDLMYVTKEDNDTIYCYPIPPSQTIFKNSGKLLSKKVWQFTEANNFIHPTIEVIEDDINVSYTDNPKPIGVALFEGISEFTISRTKDGKPKWIVVTIYAENETHIQVKFRSKEKEQNIFIIPKNEYKIHDPEDYPEKVI